MTATIRDRPVTACPLPVVRGLSRTQAAAYIGVSPSLFDLLIRDGKMPKPKRANARTIWDRRALDQAFDRLQGGEIEEADDWETAV